MALSKDHEQVLNFLPLFGGHVINQEAEQTWVCRKPGCSEYWFGVTVGPGLVCVWGDIDELLLRPHEHYAFGWATGLRPSNYDYALGKKALNQELKRFSPDLANQHLVQLEEEAREVLAQGDEDDAEWKLDFVRAVRDDWDGETEQSWVLAQVDAGDDEPWRCREFTRGSLLSYAALCWWAEKMREARKAQETPGQKAGT